MKKVIKKERNIKGDIYSRLPISENNKKEIKNIYYDFLAWPIQRFKNKRNYGIRDFFCAVNIETTTHCNRRCKFCPNSKYNRGLKKNEKRMNEKLFKKIIEELAEINYRGIIRPFFYGEPLVDERMSKWVKHIKEKLPKAKVFLNTNGLVLTIPIYKKLCQAGVDYFMISQYTEKMLSNVKEVFEYLQTRPQEENKINYRVFNKEEFTLSNRGGEVDVPVIAERPFCAYPGHYDLSIDYKGDVLLCCNDYHGKVIFGNVKNERIIDIWKKLSYYKLRKEVRTGTYKLPICKKCVGIE
jgi:radical SAM protein with 4Fe4S-binding SPASM domain